VYLRKYLPIIPDDILLGQLLHVLDVGCGQHQWGRALFHYLHEQMGPHLIEDVRIEGIDLPDVAPTTNARQRAGRGQVFVTAGDMFHLPAERTGYYSLVHVRFLFPYVSPAAWPRLLAELTRVCKPGGWFLWMEPMIPTYCEQAPGWNRWIDQMEQAIKFLGGSPRIGEQMDVLLHHAGPWQEIKREIVMLPLGTSSSSGGHLSSERYLMVHSWLTALQPILVAAAGRASPSIDRITHHALADLNRQQVVSQWQWTMVLGKKLGDNHSSRRY
jgi:SAM-dependent methyltransferase